MLTTWNIQWLNANGQRKYPLAADATGVDTTGSFTIPDDFILELDLPVHAGEDVGPGRFFVQNIGAYATGYGIVIGYQPAVGVAVTVATALIPAASHVRDSVYALGGVSPFDDTIGKIVIGRLDSIAEQPPGFWTFVLANTRLEPDAIRPILRGVSSLSTVNGGQQSSLLRGDIEFQAGTNMQIVAILAEGQDPILRFNAISGEGTVEQCVCEGDAAPTTPISNFNGVRPTSDGSFYLVGDECLQLVPIDNGLKLVDLCSAPCCGCAELEKITRDLDRLGTQAASVEDFANRLSTSVDAMAATVLGSRLGDSSCIACE